jgi:hypothetical protein
MPQTPQASPKKSSGQPIDSPSSDRNLATHGLQIPAVTMTDALCITT